MPEPLSDDQLDRLREMLDEPEPTPNGYIMRKLLAEVDQLREELRKTQDRVGVVTRQRDRAREDLSLVHRSQSWERRSLETAVRAQRTAARRARGQRDELIETVRSAASELPGWVTPEARALRLRDLLHDACDRAKEEQTR